MRKEHCAFVQDDGQGRCIADCHYNKDCDTDCIGAEGKTTCRPQHHEVQVSGGRYEPPIVAPQSEVLKDANGQTYVWGTTPNGIKYKKYTNFTGGGVVV